MDGAVVALIAGIVAVVAISKIPGDWMKAAGGLLIAVTVLVIATDALRLIFR